MKIINMPPVASLRRTADMRAMRHPILNIFDSLVCLAVRSDAVLTAKNINIGFICIGPQNGVFRISPYGPCERKNIRPVETEKEVFRKRHIQLHRLKKNFVAE